MGHSINHIEGAVLAALQNDVTLGAYVKSFELYDGQFNAVDISQFKGLLPACFVSFLEDSFVEVSANQTYMDRMTISVIVASRNLGTGLQSKSGVEGTQQMMDDVKNVLHKNNLSLSGVVGMILLRRGALIVDKNLSVFGMDFQIEFVD